MRHVAPLLLPLLSSCIIGMDARVWVTEEEAFEIDRASLTSLSCTTHNGAVAVAGNDGDKIVVRVKKQGGGVDAEDAEAALRAIEILHKRADGGVALGWRWREPRSSSWHASVSFDIAQPSSLPIKVETHNGGVRTT